MGSIQADWVSTVFGRVSSLASRYSNTFHNSSGSEISVSPQSLDTSITNGIFGLLESIGIETKNPNPLTKQLPLVSSPTPVILSVAVYLAVVCIWSSYIRAAGLKPIQRNPRSLQCLVICHNLFLCGLSLFMGLGIVLEAWRQSYSFWGNRPRNDQPAMAYFIYIFYVSKLYEFVDTVIMLLKRNLRQISYLHIYHHASISVIWWLLCYICPGGDAYFSAAFNSWIHVAMYLYYLLAATIAKDEVRRRKYLSWGKYLTMMQMVQFVSFIAQATYGLLTPGLYPKGISTLLFFYSLSLLLFFCDFFAKKYFKSGAAGKSNKAE